MLSILETGIRDQADIDAQVSVSLGAHADKGLHQIKKLYVKLTLPDMSLSVCQHSSGSRTTRYGANAPTHFVRGPAASTNVAITEAKTTDSVVSMVGRSAQCAEESRELPC